MTDYADVIDGSEYTLGLAEHVDIPQSDAGIAQTIRTYIKYNKIESPKILDLGCGPGRITKLVANSIRDFDYSVTGLDISEGFIAIANKNNTDEKITFINQDFIESDLDESSFDVIFLQGFYHHIDPQERPVFLEKTKQLLKDGGLIILGDEYIPDYNTEEERVVNVAGLYAYVIASALRSNSPELAKIEAMNVVDDVCAGTDGAGHSDDNLRDYIYKQSATIYESIFKNGVQAESYRGLLRETAQEIKKRSAELASTQEENHDRGDYKISIEKQKIDLEQAGFAHVETKRYGPVDWLGGMGLVICKK